MSIPLIINGATFNYPTDGDAPPWGNDATAWAVGVTNALLPKTGGLFQLTGVLDFGENFGIRIKDLIQNSPDPVSTVGVFRFAQTATIAWRNADNTANLALGVNALNQLVLNGVPVGGGTGSIPGGVQQLLASDGAGNFYNVPYGTSGYILQSTGAGTTWIPAASIPVTGGIDVVTGLPVSGTVGQVVYNTVDALLYRWDGTQWTAAIPSTEISGQITSGQITPSAIGSVQLANGAVTAAKTALAALDASTGNLNASVVNAAQLVAGAVGNVALASGAVDASKTALAAIDASTGNLTANSVTSNQLVTGAVIAGKIATNAIVSANIQAGQIIASLLAVGAVTAASIQAGAVTTAALAAGSVVAATIAAGAITAVALAAGSVTANAIAAGSVTTSALNVLIGGGNTAPNSSFEALGGSPANRPLYYGQYNNASISTTYTRPAGRASGTFAYGLQANANSTSTFGLTSASNIDPSVNAGGGVQGSWIPNTEYVVSFYAKKTNGATWSNMNLGWNTAPATITPTTNPNLTTSFQRYVFTLTWGASVEALGAFFVTVQGTTANGDVIIIDDLQIEQGDVVTTWTPYTPELLPGTIVANMLAANSVVAGSIAAGAVTAGSIATNSISAGMMVTGLFQADNVLTRGLTVRDNSGNIILAAGVPLTSSNITPSAAWVNANISMNTNGSLNGAGGGAVTPLGISAIGAGNPITSGNITTYISGAAIGYAQIGSVDAGTITVGSLNAAIITTGALRGINIQAGAFITQGSYLVSATTNGQTSITVGNTTDFASSGTAMIAGDLTNDYNLFTYTGKSSNTLTGISGMLAHSANAMVIPYNGTNACVIAISDVDGAIEGYGNISGSTLGPTVRANPRGNANYIGDPAYLTGGTLSAVSAAHGVAGYANLAGVGGVYGHSTSSTGYGVYGTSTTGDAVYGNSTGVGFAGVAGHSGVAGNGVRAEGAGSGAALRLNVTSTGAHASLNPLPARPSTASAGDLAMLFTTGGGIGTRTGTPKLCWFDGTNWNACTSTVFSG